jgi:predicted MFS family arabinose efflux permease
MVASVSGFMVVSTLGILLPSISADLTLSPAKQGLLGSAAFWGNITLAIPMSWWTSRFGARRLTAVTLVLSTAALSVQGWAPAFGVLLAGRLAFGITIIARQPARVILTQQWFAPREFVLVNSLSNVLFGLVVGGGLLAAPFILAAFGDNWRATLNTFAGLFASLTVLWIIFGRERKSQETRPDGLSRDLGVIRGALGYRDLWIAGSGFLGANFAWSAFLSFYPTLMLDNYGVALTLSGAILAIGIVVGGGVGLGFGFWVMKRGNTKALLRVLGVLMTITYIGMTVTGSIPALIVLTVLNGIAWGFWPLLFTVPFHLPRIRPREVAVAAAFIMMMASIGGALGPLAAGFLQEALGGLRLALLMISFTSLALTAAGIMLRSSGQTQAEESPAPATSD